MNTRCQPNYPQPFKLRINCQAYIEFSDENVRIEIWAEVEKNNIDKRIHCEIRSLFGG